MLATKVAILLMKRTTLFKKKTNYCIYLKKKVVPN